MKKSIAVILVEGFADWEVGPILPAARHYFSAEVITASLDGNAVRSIGGLRVQPDKRLADLKPAAAHMWILPGSDFWVRGPRGGVSEALQARAKAGKPIAAICGATLALGYAGLLDNAPHTSNSLDFLKQHLPAYRGEKHYRDERSVSGNGLITAPASAPVSFAVEVLRALYPDQEQLIQTFRQQFAAEFATKDSAGAIAAARRGRDARSGDTARRRTLAHRAAQPASM
jgi:putative intracellular protease/amidase